MVVVVVVRCRADERELSTEEEEDPKKRPKMWGKFFSVRDHRSLEANMYDGHQPPLLL